jgi:hypothetical protein
MCPPSGEHFCGELYTNKYRLRSRKITILRIIIKCVFVRLPDTGHSVIQTQNFRTRTQDPVPIHTGLQRQYNSRSRLETKESSLPLFTILSFAGRTRRAEYAADRYLASFINHSKVQPLPSLRCTPESRSLL